MPGPYAHGALPPPSEDSEMPGHTHGALPPFLRGIPIDWSEGHFIWAREGCECVVKFCPQHCRELIGTASSDHESEDGSTPGPSLRVDASDPYGLSSSNYDLSSPDYSLSSNDDEAAGGSGRHGDVDDDDHNSEVDNDADDDGAGSGRSDEAHDDGQAIPSTADDDPRNPSVLPSIEGIHQPGEGSPTLSASAEDTAQQDDPEATISPDNRHHEAEGMGAPSNQDQPDSGNAEVLQEFLAALPEELRNEIPIPPASAPPRLPVLSAHRPAYQTSRRLAREVRHLAQEARALSDSVSPRPGGPGGHLHQRNPSDILAKVLNTSPSPAPGSSQAPRGGYGSVSGRTPAQQPNQSPQTMPPMGFFPASAPKPVARRLFSRPDPPQLPHLRPTPAPGTASAHNTADKVGEVEEGSNGGGEASEVGESSKVGERSGMVTRSQGRRRGRAGGEEQQEERRDALDEGYQTKEGTHDDQQSEQEEEQEQDIQGEPSGSNVEGQLEEESSGEDELAGEKTSTKSRSKRGRPRKSGNTTYTYGKRGKRRKI